jgi:Domain of unknown function (DUF4347)
MIGALGIALNAALKLNKNNVKVLIVENAEDAATQIENNNIKIKNLFVASHGTYKNADFNIGTSYFNSVGSINQSEGLTNIAKHLEKGAEIVLLACHVGSSFNGGTTLLKALAKKMNATVYGNQSWSLVSPNMFNSGFAKTFYQNGANGAGFDNTEYSKESRSNAYKNSGKWSKVSPDGTTSTIQNVYFDSFGKIRYSN